MLCLVTQKDSAKIAQKSLIAKMTAKKKLRKKLLAVC